MTGILVLTSSGLILAETFETYPGTLTGILGLKIPLVQNAAPQVSQGLLGSQQAETNLHADIPISTTVLIDGEAIQTTLQRRMIRQSALQRTGFGV